MPRDAAARHEQVVTSLTILQLRMDLLQRQLARHEDLSAADRAWLETALGEITQTVRVLTALMGARGGVLEASRHDVAANERFTAFVPLIRRGGTFGDVTPGVSLRGAEQPDAARGRK